MTIEEKIKNVINQIYEIRLELESHELNEQGKICVTKLKQCRFLLREVIAMGEYTNV